MTLHSSLEHIHKRKRKHQKHLEQYPNKNPKIKMLDDAMLIIASIGPMFMLPQILKIYSARNAASISILTFALLGTTHLTWIYYGFVHKDRQIMTSHSLFFLACLALIVGAIIF
ncbi:MAG: PQ-loop domain-containing transporter [Nanoarchaeota archaeon]